MTRYKCRVEILRKKGFSLLLTYTRTELMQCLPLCSRCIGLKRCRLLYYRCVRKSIKQRAQIVLTHQQQQQQHLSHLDRVGIVFQKYRVRFQKPQEWENPRGNPNRIKYRSYTGVWVNYTVKKTQKVVVLVWFWWMGLELSLSIY